jgi:hypothetical protein
MRKCATIYSYMRMQLVIYDFATASFWISLNMRKIWFYFLSVYLPPYLRVGEMSYSFFWYWMETMRSVSTHVEGSGALPFSTSRKWLMYSSALLMHCRPKQLILGGFRTEAEFMNVQFLVRFLGIISLSSQT